MAVARERLDSAIRDVDEIRRFGDERTPRRVRNLGFETREQP